MTRWVIGVLVLINLVLSWQLYTDRRERLAEAQSGAAMAVGQMAEVALSSGAIWGAKAPGGTRLSTPR